jgi:hypothetical protein
VTAPPDIEIMRRSSREREGERRRAVQESACGHAELRTSESEARHQRQFAAGVGPRRQCSRGVSYGLTDTFT